MEKARAAFQNRREGEERSGALVGGGEKSPEPVPDMLMRMVHSWERGLGKGTLPGAKLWIRLWILQPRRKDRLLTGRGTLHSL